MASKRNVTYQCPFCGKRYSRESLVRHIANKHDDELPEDFTALRYTFNYVNKKPITYHGKCTECGRETPWDENKGRYDRQCGRKACHDSFVKKFEANMMRTKGITRISATASGQEKMLANRRISGKYKFQDGVEKTYTGSYEKKALEFMDKVMNIKSDDIMTPGPVFEYEWNGKPHIYISDMLYLPYNLIIEVKDGGDNPNTRNMEEYRAKQRAKEEYIIKNTNYNYLRLVNNELDQLLAVFADLKMTLVDNSNERVIHINEHMSMPVVGINSPGSVILVPNKLQNNAFAGNDINSYAIADNIKLDNLIIRDEEGRLVRSTKDYLFDKIYEVYEVKVDESTLETIKNNMDNVVDENFIYETLFKHPAYTDDQIRLEENATKLIDYYYQLDCLSEMVELNITNKKFITTESDIMCDYEICVDNGKKYIRSKQFPDLVIGADNYGLGDTEPFIILSNMIKAREEDINGQV